MHPLPQKYRLILVAVGIIAIKVILNLSNAIYLRIRQTQYVRFLTKQTAESSLPLKHGKRRTIALLKQAGVANVGVPITQPTGFNMVATLRARIFDQYPSLIAILASHTLDAFDEAIGTYNSRALDAINPLYWISLIVYLPTRACTALGAKSESIPVKILQGLYWVAGVIISALFAFAKPSILNWIKGIIDQFAA